MPFLLLLLLLFVPLVAPHGLGPKRARIQAFAPERVAVVSACVCLSRDLGVGCEGGDLHDDDDLSFPPTHSTEHTKEETSSTTRRRRWG